MKRIRHVAFSPPPHNLLEIFITMAPPHPDEGEEDDASGGGVVARDKSALLHVSFGTLREVLILSSTAKVEKLIADVDGVSASKKLRSLPPLRSPFFRGRMAVRGLSKISALAPFLYPSQKVRSQQSI